MTKEVMLSISGLQWGTDFDRDNIETIVRAEYYKKNEVHYLLYEEALEGFEQTSKNRIKFKDNILELKRQGLMNTHMIFEENKRHITNYATPYGSLMLGVRTERIEVEEREDFIGVVVEYTLDVEEEILSRNKIELKIKERPC